MTTFTIDPITDSRWQLFLEEHPDASIFHTPGWLDALRRTYGYEPIAYVSQAPGSCALVAGIPFCRIESALTGRRLVSLPFSDHCQPLTPRSEILNELLSAAEAETKGWKYVEVRPLVHTDSYLAAAGLSPSRSAVIHRLDLTQGLDAVFAGLNKQCVRTISRSEREQLQYEEGRSPDLLEKFYKLLLVTRRRHQLPPQPLAWFKNLIECCGERLKIRVASKNTTPVAATITFSFKRVMTYKYGCSDSRFNPLGGMSFLIWRTIQQAVDHGAVELDLGRSDLDHLGLIAFKDHWGAAQYELTYYRHPAIPKRNRASSSVLSDAARRLMTTVPDSVFSRLGGLLYRHVG